MSYSVFFAFSSGLTKPFHVEKGTRQRILDRIASTEETLGLKRDPTYTPEGEPQRPGWRWNRPESDMLKTLGKRPQTTTTTANYALVRQWDLHKERLGAAVREHNHHVRWLYEEFQKGTTAKPRSKALQAKLETITPAEATEFWGGLRILSLPSDLWTRDHYRDYIEHIGELLITGESRGTHLDCKLTSKQAASILNLFDCEMDQFFGFDVRASITLDQNLKSTSRVAFSDDGGYDWCSHCGPIDSGCFFARVGQCARAKRGQCDLKNENPAEFDMAEDATGAV